MARCFLAAAVFCLIAGASSILASGPVIREVGAVYLEDFTKKNPQVAVLAEGPIFFDITMKRFLGNLKAGQLVELQAISDGGYRVKGKAYQGQVVGWIDPKYLQTLAPEFVEELNKANDRLAMVRALIAKNEVALGMTQPEVLESLGKPQKKTSRLDAKGKQEVWEYVRYDNVPQTQTVLDAFGRPFNTTVYLKVPVGQLAVVFNDDLVSSLEQTEGTLAGGGAKIVPAPIEIVY